MGTSRGSSLSAGVTNFAQCGRSALPSRDCAFYVAPVNQQWDQSDISKPTRSITSGKFIWLVTSARRTRRSGCSSSDEIVRDPYALALRRTGRVVTLIKWDADVPLWADLQGEALRAEIAMSSGQEVTPMPPLAK